MIALLLAAALAVTGEPEVAFELSDRRISESSGLAASVAHPGIVYTHNDSDGAPQLFALDSKGRTKAVFTIAGARARDWEGMAIGKDEQGRPALFIADIGDNMHGAWPYVTVYRVPEPKNIRSQTLNATAFRMRYEDGPRDAESIMIDPRTNRLYIASKELGGGDLYQAPARLKSSNTLKKVGRVPLWATDAAFAPDGSSFVIRGYFSAQLFSAPGKRIDTIGLPSQEQGEAVTYAPDGRSLLVSSEGDDRKIWRVPLPKEALPSPKATSGEQPVAAPGEEPEEGTNRGLGLFVVVAVVGAAVLLGRRRKG